MLDALAAIHSFDGLHFGSMGFSPFSKQDDAVVGEHESDGSKYQNNINRSDPEIDHTANIRFSVDADMDLAGRKILAGPRMTLAAGV